tara:strand:- start:527 stop:1333 length:807 start_codon:yes stop_codon:yes gene_type:complete
MFSSATKVACGVQYIGTQYCGWQSQKDQKAIQDHIEEAISSVANENIKIYGSGRTDSGVHADEQVFHFSTTVARDSNQWVKGINSGLPRDILIQWSKEVPMDFDARRSAIYRRYDYCLKTKKPDVFLNSRALYIDYLIDIERMKLAAKYLIGKHDFSSFRASSCQSKSPIREMQSIDFINEDNNCLRISFIGNAFLHHMIRNIMGTLIDVGIGRLEPDQMKEILESKDRQKASKTVSPEGLYLIGIRYPEKYKLPTKDIEIRLSNLDL